MSALLDVLTSTRRRRSSGRASRRRARAVHAERHGRVCSTRSTRATASSSPRSTTISAATIDGRRLLGPDAVSDGDRPLPGRRLVGARRRLALAARRVGSRARRRVARRLGRRGGRGAPGAARSGPTSTCRRAAAQLAAGSAPRRRAPPGPARVAAVTHGGARRGRRADPRARRASGRIARAAVGAGILVAIVLEVGAEPFVRGLASRRLRRAVAAALALGAVGHVGRRLAVADRSPAVSGCTLGWGESVSAYYRSQFLNTVLPGGVVGDVHRAVVARAQREQHPSGLARGRRGAHGRSGGAARPRGGGAGVARDVGLRSRCGHRAPRGRRRLRRTRRRGGRERARARRRSAASWRPSGSRSGPSGTVVKVIAASLDRDRRARGDLRRGLHRRRRRGLARAAGRRRADRRARRVDPAQHRRMGTARGRRRVGVRRRRDSEPRRGHRRLDRVRRAGADRRRSRRGRGRGIRSAPPSRCRSEAGRRSSP